MALFEFFLFSDFPKVNEVNAKYALYKITGVKQNQMVVLEMALFDYLLLFYSKSMAV